jgi:hypothetical protein
LKKKSWKEKQLSKKKTTMANTMRDNQKAKE